jgi:hypothetical protein
VRWESFLYRCGAAMRVIDGRRKIVALVAGRAATRRHLKAFISNVLRPIASSFVWTLDVESVTGDCGSSSLKRRSANLVGQGSHVRAQKVRASFLPTHHRDFLHSTLLAQLHDSLSFIPPARFTSHIKHVPRSAPTFAPHLVQTHLSLRRIANARKLPHKF